MAPYNIEGYSLLQHQSHDESKEDLNELETGFPARSSRNAITRHFAASNVLRSTASISIAVSGAINIFLVFLLATHIISPKYFETGEATAESAGLSFYAGLDPNPIVKFPYSTGYGPEVTNHSLLDERWEAIDINAGVVAISHEWASEHNLSPTQPFPWDTSKGVYLLTAFHTLHCLKNIHRLLYDAHHGRPLSRDIGHAMHCVDHLRKDAMCSADDYLLPSPKGLYGTPGPRGQSRICRDWDALVGWAEDRHACYEHVSDDEEGFAQHHDEIERYRNCPPGSPYMEAMEEFFKSRDESNTANVA